jgi:CubicO group peptidase (beta-lactamase class C family)
LDGTIFDFHHTALVRNESGASKKDSGTVYGVASVTKTFTVLSVLLEASLNLDEPVSRYVSELKGTVWSDVTLRLLGGQLAGIPRDSKYHNHDYLSAKI